MNIRLCKVDEYRELAAFARRTFLEAFAGPNNPADMAAYIAKAFHPEQIKREIQHPHSRFYLAKTEDQLMGYIKLNFAAAQTELQDDTALEVERIYVDASFQGSGIGKALMQKAVEVAHSHQLVYIWLGVWEHNESSIAFYQKQGFVPFDSHQFVLGTDVQTDVLMKKMVVNASTST